MAKWHSGTFDWYVAPRVLGSGGAHLRRILCACAVYYNQTQTHLTLNKDAPIQRAARRLGKLAAIPVLAGLHHQYVWI